MTSKTFSRFLAILLILSPVFSFLSCSSSVDSDPDAQIPTITSISGDISTVMNIAKELSVGVSVSDKGTLSYQWYVAESKIAEGTAISDATGARFTPQTQSVGIFYYYCVITNRLGSSTRSVTSPRITYTVGDSVNAIKPVIAQQPENVTTDFGEDFLLSVNAYSPDGGTLSYQWYFSSSADGKATALEGASESSYKGTVSADTIGSYYCVVTNTIEDNGDGGAKSAIARTNIVIVSNDMVNANTPVITSQPADAEAIIPAIHVFSVGAYTADEGILTYQWYSVLEGESEGTAIEGAAESKLRLTESKVGKTGYYCVITSTIEDNGDGGAKSASVTSETAWLTTVYLKDVVPAPTFTKQPPQMSVAPYNQSITLSCTAEVAGYAVRYKWYESFDGTSAAGKAVSEGSGADTATFTTPAFTEKGIRYFYCVATTVIAENEGGDVNTVATISDVVSVACTGLPVVQIDTADGNPTPAKEKHNGRLQIYYPDGKKYDSGTANEFTVKVRGNATAWYPKHPYKLKLPKKMNLLNIDSSENKDKNWVLLAGYCDKTLLRTKIGFYTASLFNDIIGNEKLYIPHSEFVDVVLNGEYIGNYCLTDSVKEGSERLAVNEKATDEGGIGFVAEYDGGYYANEPKWFKTQKKQYPYTFKFPDTDDADFDSYMAWFEENMNKFESALYDEDSEDDWKNYIDIESFARWFLAHNILANIDTNYFFSKKTSDDTSKLIMGPVWDFEWSIGIGWYYGSRPRPADYWCVSGWYFAELLKKAEFVAEVKSQWEKLNSAYPDLAGTINAKMDEYAENIGTSQKINFMRWNILNTSVSVGGIPLGDYEAELDCDKQFMTNRIPWLDSAINGL